MERVKGYTIKEDAGRGFRRVVASPMPKKIVEEELIKTIVSAGHVVIAVGGGGVPVIENEDGSLKGVPAVIDKDLASEKLAEILNADILMILTAVEQVAINFNKPDQKNLSLLTVEEAKRYMEEGHFAEGSMLPKVKAAMMFAESKMGRKSIIASLSKAKLAVMGRSGTSIILSPVVERKLADLKA